eukprot:gene8805-biopygen16663
MGSGGSTFARLELKGIDGMTPQGVEPTPRPGCPSFLPVVTASVTAAAVLSGPSTAMMLQIQERGARSRLIICVLPVPSARALSLRTRSALCRHLSLLSASAGDLGTRPSGSGEQAGRPYALGRPRSRGRYRCDTGTGK